MLENLSMVTKYGHSNNLGDNKKGGEAIEVNVQTGGGEKTHGGNDIIYLLKACHKNNFLSSAYVVSPGPTSRN